MEFNLRKSSLRPHPQINCHKQTIFEAFESPYLMDDEEFKEIAVKRFCGR